MAYSVLRMEKIHSMGSLQTRHEHNFRDLKLAHVDENASYRNEEMINFSGLDYKELWYRRMKDIELETGAPVKKTKASVLAYEFVVTFTHDAEINIEAWKKKNVEWFCKTFGEKNVLSMQYHDDEATPHIHAIVIPIDERNRLCAKSFTGGRAKMRALQTSYGNAMNEVGLKRGEPFSRSKNMDLAKFYQEINKAANEQAPVMMPQERVDDYVQRVNEYVQGVRYRALDEKLKYKRRAELAETRMVQMAVKYGEAMALWDDVEENFEGDQELTRERIHTYRKVEHSVPRKTLNGLLDNLLKKFPLSENVLYFNERRRKRRKKQDDGSFDEKEF